MRAWLIYATTFLLTSALGVVFVFLEDVQVDHGLADWHIGVVAGSGFAAALVAQLVLSPLADRGRIVPLSTVALVAGILGPLGFAYGDDVVELAVSRGLAGIGLGVFGLIARKALIGLDVEGSGEKLGLYLSIAVAGFIAGPLIGALLEPLGFEAPFLFVSIGLTVLGVPATITIARTPIAATAEVDYSDLGLLVRRPRIQAAMIVQLIVFGYIGVFDATIDRFLTDLGASTGTVAIVIVFIGGPLLVFPRFAGRLAERRGGAAVMLPAMVVILPVMFGYGLAEGVVVVTLFGFLHGSGESFATISSQVLVLEVTGPERAAVGSALLETSGLLSATVAASFAPSLYGAYGQSMFVGTGLVGVALALLAFQRVRNAWDEPLIDPAAATPTTGASVAAIER